MAWPRGGGAWRSSGPSRRPPLGSGPRWSSSTCSTTAPRRRRGSSGSRLRRFASSSRKGERRSSGTQVRRMTETKQLLERAKRAFDPPTDVMDALVVRRDRKRRDQRVLPSPPESWSRVQLDSPPGGNGPSILVAGPDRLVAVGDGEPATAWTSADGATWTRTPSEDLDGADISDITSGAPGFIAAGSDGARGGDGKGTVWKS